jgi:hypothetical protein
MLASVALSAVLAAPALAVPLNFTNDLPNDRVSYRAYEVYAVGSAVDAGKLYFEVRLNFPEAGIVASDSYGVNQIDPGDLVIAVGKPSVFDTGAILHGIAVTSHGNIAPQAYPGEVWDDVVKGRLYTHATFADGTYEAYQAKKVGQGQPYTPNDRDGDNFKNSYPTLIKYGTEVTGVSNLSYDAADPALTWDYEITGWVETSAIGLGVDQDYALFWTMECGNDGAEHHDKIPPIPEPATGSILLLGLLSVRRLRRR